MFDKLTKGKQEIELKTIEDAYTHTGENCELVMRRKSSEQIQKEEKEVKMENKVKFSGSNKVKEIPSN